MIGMRADPASEAFEAALDWLECTGVVVERLDPLAGALPADTPAEIRELLTRGEASLPIIAVGRIVLSHSAMPSRAALARTVGVGRLRVRRAIARQLAAIGAAAAVGTREDIELEITRARALGISENAVRAAQQTGARFAHVEAA